VQRLSFRDLCRAAYVSFAALTAGAAARMPMSAFYGA
jgi:hypothetical protein